MTHTPGPWEVGSAIEIRAASGYVVARLGDPIHMHNEITAGNARLIAAAPELLESLRAMSDYIESLKWGQAWPGRPHAMADAARAAIAKAEGGPSRLGRPSNPGWEVEGFIDRLTRRDTTNSERLVLEAIGHLRSLSRDCDSLRETNAELRAEIERMKEKQSP
jgi:hypothetical protein